MALLEVLGIASAEELDPSRSLKLGALELGTEATAEAIRILGGGEFVQEVAWTARTFSKPVYWSVVHRTEGNAEIFGFPPGTTGGLPTAIEVALVRAIAAASNDDHVALLEGNSEIVVGPNIACRQFLKVTAILERPLVGRSLLHDGASQVVIADDIDARLNKVALDCLANSFRTSPMKFRFLELYRMMEARFLDDIRTKLLAAFLAEPSAALNGALESLKSEMNQVIGLAEAQQDAFEACWNTLDQMRNTNRFAAALFRRVEKKGAASGGKWKTGAALVYQIRCAIVHAGEKDMIFENFPDGEIAVEAVLPDVERAALLLAGVELS